MTIWDGGGTDLLNLSGFSNNQVIKLAPGSYSSVGYHDEQSRHRLSVPDRERLWRARRGQHCGQSVANTLRGNAGNDKINGGGGDDRLYGDIGDDKLYGNAGNGHDLWRQRL